MKVIWKEGMGILKVVLIIRLNEFYFKNINFKKGSFYIFN